MSRPRSAIEAQRNCTIASTEGKAGGEAKVVLKLLALKFGPLPQGVTERVQSASIEDLDRFAERVLSAKTPDEVLG